MKMYIKGTFSGNFNVYFEGMDEIITIRHVPMSSTYQVTIDGDVITMIKDLKDNYCVYMDNTEEPEIIISRKSKIKMGIGYRTFVAIPLVEIPIGRFMCVSSDGTIITEEKDRKDYDLYANGQHVATINDNLGIIGDLKGGKKTTMTFYDGSQEYFPQLLFLFIARAIELQV